MIPEPTKGTTTDPSDAAPAPTPTDNAPTPTGDGTTPTSNATDSATDSVAGADTTESTDDAPPSGGWHPLLRVLVVLGTVAVLVGLGVFLLLRYDVVGRLVAADPTADARVGDCLAPLPEVAEGGQRQAQARLVACASPDAAYDVVGRLDGLTAAQAGEHNRCEPFVAEGGTYYTYRSIPSGGTGYLLCLRPRG